MLKKFTKKKKWARKSIARELEQGMEDHLIKTQKNQRNKRVKKFNKRYV